MTPKARITLTFPSGTSSAAVRDIAKRIADAIRTDLENDGEEVFGKEAPRVLRSLEFATGGGR